MHGGDALLARALKRALGNPHSLRQDVLADLLTGEVRLRPVLTDYRSSGRMGVSLEATLSPCGASGRRCPALVTEVGLSGLRVELDGGPPELGPVLVEMCLPTPGECHLLAGKVSWVNEPGLRIDASRRPAAAVKTSAADRAEAGVELASECTYAWFAALLRIVGAARAVAEPPATR